MERIEISSTDERVVGYGLGWLMFEESPRFITGRLCTLIESLGLRESQEKAVKDIVRQEVISWFYEPSNTIQVAPALNNVVRDIMRIVEKKENGRPITSEGPMTTLSHRFQDWEFQIVAECKKD